ncbi:MAG: sporulation initiation factor Spo0A C-terminal domain-containing protein, partial [Clostridia bacterium]|nr:sporulation initiation factor Spo0A C-terminal domain-containing protein [Clostridia bacterium]
NLFLTLGIPAHIKGYQYLREAVRMVMENHDVINRITKELYPGIARKFDTTASKVERAMRHAIEVAWTRGRLDAVNQMYGYRVFAREDKPTNVEFIAVVSDKLTVKKTA